MLRLKVIACDVLNRELSYFSSMSKNYVDITYLHQGLHDTPEKLNSKLQEAVNKANEGFPYNHFGTVPHYDYIIVGYGLCSNGIIGLTSEKIPMIIPRAHDCITLLLGSKERYKEHFDNNPGTYWFSSGWIERGWQPSELKYKTLYNKYVNKYGEDNAEFLMEIEQSWLKDYKSATYINWPLLGNSEYYKDFTYKSAQFLKWEFNELIGDPCIIKNMLDGCFEEREVLVVPPGKKVIQSYDENIIKVE